VRAATFTNCLKLRLTKLIWRLIMVLEILGETVNGFANAYS